ncbi:hypothetical protein L1049_018391 [Liquidambar formosana]|uniref:Lon N-terminal domain-containing protein n=1 Tax=Liquidambar formosana TaxID=63359 RepID=A0AAP0WMU9_LIQFO
MMDEESILERERHQIEQIRELEFEELQVEEVDDHQESSSDDDATNDRGYRGASASDEFTFNTCLASLHTYLGEVEDTHHRLAFLDGGAILTLPLFYLEGVVLFPEATLPLRVIQPNFIASVERALSKGDALYTIGVVRVYRDPDNQKIKFATVGTTAEIRQYRRLEDGSLNVVTRGQQRFRLRRRWIDVEGAPCGEVQIIQEDLPLRTPRDAFGKLAPLSNLQSHKLSCTPPLNASHAKRHVYGDEDNDSEDSFESELSLTEMRMHQSAVASCCGYDIIDESTSSDDEKFVCNSDLQLRRSHLNDSLGSLHPKHEKRNENVRLGIDNGSILGRQSLKGEGRKKGWMVTELNQSRRASRAFWPYWVYRMYDSYCLAQRVAGSLTLLSFFFSFAF